MILTTSHAHVALWAPTDASVGTSGSLYKDGSKCLLLSWKFNVAGQFPKDVATEPLWNGFGDEFYGGALGCCPLRYAAEV